MSESHVRPYLPFKDEDNSLRDIADAIVMIETFTSGMDFEDFREDPKTVAAVERKLQIISEAAVRLGNDAETRCPGPPWRDIRGMGIGCVTSMSGLSCRSSGKTVQADLPPLKAAVLRALSPPRTRQDRQRDDLG